ncbi:MAG: hypothetical protein QM791_06325 [Ferruginibacter sp.]
MKKIFYLLGAFILFAGCSKDETGTPPVTVPADDVRTVFLKEIVAQSLPNPYYRFVYDTAGYVKQAAFASNLAVYDVEYASKRVKKLTNNRNGHLLLYNYTGTHVTRIDEFTLANTKIYSYEFSYNTMGKLVAIVWKEFFDDPAGIVSKKLTFGYYTDGNLSILKNYLANNGALELTITKEFSHYDDKQNVDDFYMMADFFDSFLFLPQVKLQQNNPGKERITGAVNDFEITYTWEFSNNLPVKKVIDMRQVRGSQAGQVKRFTHQFSYY